MEKEDFRTKVAEIQFSHAEEERDALRKERKSEFPLIIDFLTTFAALGIIWLWQGKENLESLIVFIIPIVILAVPIKRKLRKEWPDSWASIWTYPLEKFQFTVALLISSALVIPTYFIIIKPLMT